MREATQTGPAAHDTAAAPMTVQLLGPLRIGDADAPGALPAKGRALLAYLAARAGEPVSRDLLADLCWERSGPEQARQSLRQAISVLRRTLPPELSERLVATPETVALTDVATDVAQFDALARGATPEGWSEALRLWRGAFLDDLTVGSEGFDGWAERERARLHGLRGDLLARLAEHRLGEGRTAEAIELARTLTTHDPLREDGHRLLIRALAAAGRRAEALSAYDAVAELLQRELGVRPDPSTRALADALREGGPSAPRPQPVPAPTRERPAVPALALLAPQAPKRTQWPLAMAGAVLLLAASVAGVWWATRAPEVEDRRPVLVVTPFEALTSDAETAALARAITTRLSGGLSGLPTVRVRSAEARSVAPDLRVDGSIQRADNGGVLVSAKLIRGSGEVLHQAEFASPARASIELQDAILGRVGRQITERLDALAHAQRPANADAQRATEMTLAARNMVNRGDTSDRVMAMFREAMRLDPENPDIIAHFGNALVAHALGGTTPRMQQRNVLDEALRLFGEAAQRAPHQQVMLYGRCQALRALPDPPAARQACDTALTAMPWSARAYKEQGYVLLYLGQFDRADEFFRAAERLEPQSTIRWTWAAGAGATALLQDRARAAMDWFEIGATLRPRFPWYHLFAAVAARRAGLPEREAVFLARFREMPRTTTLDDYFDSFFPPSIDYSADMRDRLVRLKGEMAALMP